MLATTWASSIPTGSISKPPVSTSADQIALAPGYLQREWTENGRRYFHYKMDRPMLPFYCFLSARWDVKRGEWHGVPIEIYHDPEARL